ncbi:helicase conserved C-terminal domain containing protein, putative [Babesia bigemina]|uniref:Helicase conserved C-terminal domain containing protein, putative n=1 Tax=Babesia bigemina TaxID=5866 RepID=A0A061DEK6_BABBI|nr:helicase conserved C-terminal domain containing protein, putative [Babesia bigemina]CDR97445.1 helicase conserved C-terminal domain containing protein, putative [Babesia bigemina]|eukprot:XP_012769631.1 helicase conserved C-terminal domain containing protein, putative [Babesia bigemina]
MSDSSAGNTVFTFGKHKGRSFEDVYHSDPSYGAWAMQIESPSGPMLQFCSFLRSMGYDANSKESRGIAAKEDAGRSMKRGINETTGAASAVVDSRRPTVANGRGAAAAAANTPGFPNDNRASLHSKALDNCLEAKWRRLTQKVQEVDEEEDEAEWYQRRRNTAGTIHDTASILDDDSMTLQRVLEAAVAARRQQLPVAKRSPKSSSSTLPKAKNTGTPNTSTVSSVFNGGGRKNEGANSVAPGRNSEPGQMTLDGRVIKSAPKGKTETKANDAAACKESVPGNTFGNLPGDNGTSSPMRNATPKPNQSATWSTSPGKKKLRLEGIVALVLHSEDEFSVAFQKALKDMAVWSNILPPPLFDFLRFLDNGMRVVKEGRTSYVLMKADKYEMVLKALKQELAGCQCPVDPIPDFILRTFPAFHRYSRAAKLPEKTQQALSGYLCDYTRKNMDRLSEIVGKELYSQLRPFQREGVEFGIRRNGRVLIGDEMGLGKTLQALAISAFYCMDWPLLIVCPSSLRFQWRDQCVRWLPHLISEDEVCTVKSGKTAIPDHTKVVIISYDLYALNEHFRHGFRVVICDESHYIKNKQAKRTRCLAPLLKETRRAILLSGTPTLNSPSELYEQISCIMPSFCSNSTFLERYCQKKLNWYTKRITYAGSQHTSELHLFLVKTVMIRRLKEHVLHELPPKLRSKVPIELPKTFLRDCKSHMATLPKNAHNDSDFSSMQEMFKKTGEAKAKGVCEYVVHMLRSEVKFIVFAHHIFLMDAIEDTLREQKCNYIRIDGSTPHSKREENVHKFQNDSSCTLALLSMTACGVGLNLTASSTVVFAELHWVPGLMIQAEDRAHRMGTKHRVINIHYLIAENSVEEMMWRVINRKWEGVTATLNGETSNLTLLKEAEKNKLTEEANQLKITELIK